MADDRSDREDVVLRDGTTRAVVTIPDPKYPPPGALDEWWDDVEIPRDPEARERWEVDGDRTAGWAMRKLAEMRGEVRRVEALAEQDLARLLADYNEKRSDIENWLADSTAGAVEFAALLNGKLLDYSKRLHDEHPQMPKTYRVPGGALTRRRNPPSVDLPEDPADLIDWCWQNNRSELLEIKPSKAAIKAAIGLTLAVPAIECDAKGEPTVPGQESHVVTAAGELLPGVVYRVGDEKYDAKPEGVA
jgi:hypothetical protein